MKKSRLVIIIGLLSGRVKLPEFSGVIMFTTMPKPLPVYLMSERNVRFNRVQLTVNSRGRPLPQNLYNSRGSLEQFIYNNMEKQKQTKVM